MQNATKKEKGLAAAQWLLNRESNKNCHASQTVSSENSALKKDRWCSEREMLVRFDEDELEKHLNSGRVIWRNDPLTPEVWQYKDLIDTERLAKVGKGLNFTKGAEFDPDEVDDDVFGFLFDKDLEGLLADNLIQPSKGKGKGKGLGKGKKAKKKTLYPLKMPEVKMN